MPFLVIVPTRDLAYVTCHPVWTTSVLILFLLLTYLCCVNSNGAGGAFLLLVLAKLLVFLLLLFTGFLGGLSLMLRSQCFVLLRFGPRLLHSMDSYQIVLGANPSGIGLVAAQTLLVYLFNVRGGLQTCLSLDINYFLYDLGPIV